MRPGAVKVTFIAQRLAELRVREAVPEREWIDALFAETPRYRDEAQRQDIEDALVQLKARIGQQLASLRKLASEMTG